LEKGSTSSAELKWRVLSEFEENQWIAKNYMLKYGQRGTVIITFLKKMFPVQPHLALPSKGYKE
jgi:hypothetical protein